MSSPQHVANDNEKISVRFRSRRVGQRYAVGSNRQNTLRQQMFADPIKTPGLVYKNAQSATSVPRFIETKKASLIVMALWLAGFALLFFMQRDTPVPTLKIVSAVAFGWASLALTYVSKAQNRKLYQSLGVIGVLLSFAVVGFNLHTGLNIQISMGLALCLASSLTLTLAAFMREKLPLLLSICISAVWIAASQINPAALQLIWLYPSLFVLQFTLSRKLRAHLSLMLTLFIMLTWLVGYASDFIPNVA